MYYANDGKIQCSLFLSLSSGSGRRGGARPPSHEKLLARRSYFIRVRRVYTRPGALRARRKLSVRDCGFEYLTFLRARSLSLAPSRRLAFAHSSEIRVKFPAESEMRFAEGVGINCTAEDGLLMTD